MLTAAHILHTSKRAGGQGDRNGFSPVVRRILISTLVVGGVAVAPYHAGFFTPKSKSAAASSEDAATEPGKDAVASPRTPPQAVASASREALDPGLKGRNAGVQSAPASDHSSFEQIARSSGTAKPRTMVHTWAATCRWAGAIRARLPRMQVRQDIRQRPREVAAQAPGRILRLPAQRLRGLVCREAACLPSQLRLRRLYLPQRHVRRAPPLRRPPPVRSPHRPQ
jgi:hypothetical protein